MPVRQKTFRIEKMTPAGGAASAASENAAACLQHQDVLDELKALRGLIEQRAPEAPQVENEPQPNSAFKSGSKRESKRESNRDQITLDDLTKLKNETDSIHRAVTHTMQELASLHFGAFANAGHARASRELDAVVESSERATQQILSAAESIDEAANTLSASLKHDQEQSLASDIRDHVVRIFEACNFQDLGGQRIAKVLTTLTFVEDRVARMLEIWGGRDALDHYVEEALGAPDGETKPPMGGPKLNGDPGHVSQQEIDAMFA
jgi:chemotaxis protein CheZ